MAIKKGVFELYAKDRQLPEKRKEKNPRQSHFFDNVIGNNIGSQMVHKRFTSDEADVASGEDQISTILAGSEPLNGSQMVHKRFTSDEADVASGEDQISNIPVGSEPLNGSQMVHKRLISDEADVASGEDQISNIPVGSEPLNGSQMVHKRFTSDALIINKEENVIISFSRLIGNQRDLVLALYKNIHMNDFLTTKELTLDEIAISSGVNKKSLKNTLFRLVSAGCISRVDQKVGRGGWVKYDLNLSLKNEIKNMGISCIVSISQGRTH